VPGRGTMSDACDLIMAAYQPTRDGAEGL
jgi:hypothetical protein